jgi:hypothetical protein
MKDSEIGLLWAVSIPKRVSAKVERRYLSRTDLYG